MICQQCAKRGLKSTIQEPCGGMTTCMAWTPGHYNKDGIWIEHQDPNSTTYSYRCSNGHHWSMGFKGGKCIYDGNK